ncbi:hypothetical protein [Fodinicurvata sediminis]|uniref:hypothetical protein n=1 Tax=Fodinicurvata sediminis TaxID=1121832 RepID=UPI0003B436C8|nr:hypothetical protein [Fodinicurvata sediminis]
MAVTKQDSTEVANGKKRPVVTNPATDYGGRVRVAHFDFTQDGAGDDGSLARLAQVPSGRVRLLCAYLDYTAGGGAGAALDVDLGHGDYSDPDGEVTAASGNAFLDGQSGENNFSQLVQIDQAFITRSGFTLQAAFTGAGVPDGTALKGYLLYVQD